jgi:hypothetical protein
MPVGAVSEQALKSLALSRRFPQFAGSLTSLIKDAAAHETAGRSFCDGSLSINGI